MSVTYDFDGSVVLVTGASGALGSAVAEAFADAGATVCGTARSSPDAFPGSFYTGDLTDETAVERVVGDVASDHGGLDCLVHCTGAWAGGDPVHETETATYEFLLDVNLRTTFLVCKHVVPHLRESDRGALVTVGSESSLSGGSGDAAYRASKAGVRLLTRSVAAENEGVVRANCLLPDVIDTPSNREAFGGAREGWSTPDEIADVVAFLCSSAADVTSGAEVPV